MKAKIFGLFIAGVFLSFAGFAQETQESLHPKLDKYYETNDPPAPVTKPSTTVIPSTTAASSRASANAGTINNVTAPQSTVKAPVVPVDTTTEQTVVQNEPVPEPVAVPTPKPSPVQPVAPTARPDPNSLYSESRLGSSTPQYDTYETNSDGAGSVTTTPK